MVVYPKLLGASVGGAVLQVGEVIVVLWCFASIGLLEMDSIRYFSGGWHNICSNFPIQLNYSDYFACFNYLMIIQKY